MKRHLLLGIALGLVGAGVGAQEAWPAIALPKEIQVFTIAEKVHFNGLPMRMQGFISAQGPDELAAWFRKNMGKHVVENKRSGTLILGCARGDYYVTIELETAGRGTRGRASMTRYDPQASKQSRIDAQEWEARLPAGSKLMYQMASEDGSKLSKHLLMRNGHSTALNRDRLTELMREDGFELEHESASAPQSEWPPIHSADGTTLFFKGQGKDAMATIFRDETGQTAIVLNTITRMERVK